VANSEFELAEQFALYTHKHCFITGKAGTGKTTLLKHVVQRTQKSVVVVAPTGVAAINAGGVTIHSMFGLPLTCFVPNDDVIDPNMATNRPRLLREHIHFRKDKLRVLRQMEMLIIDEVSMVRCDILDAIDFVLQTVRRNNRPFGAVQVLLFGDMHQLPPVVKDRDVDILRQYYRSRYFFDSLVWPQMDAVEIELQTIYRQSDARFLDLLNHIRNRKMTEEDRALLSARYDPHFKADQEGYVLLSTHNAKADNVNFSELEKLPGKVGTFKAVIEGDFPESLYPCDPELKLKKGSQVMFIRNDTEEDSYYNGKLARVKYIDSENIIVTFRDDGRDYTLHRETWENIDYSLDPETGEVVKNELGTFSQYPLRLAWAITIHKSQGLTFDKVIIDAGKSFAAGQVYVALSRCRSLEGIVLHSLIPPSALYKDERIGAFSASHHSSEALQDVFVREQALYANHLLLRLFAFGNLSANQDDWQAMLAKREFP
jgi:ATP-dependent DNA helicase PIF1